MKSASCTVGVGLDVAFLRILLTFIVGISIALPPISEKIRMGTCAMALNPLFKIWSTFALFISFAVMPCAIADFSLELDPAIEARVKDAYFSPTLRTADSDWIITRTEWSDTDERRFSDFVSAIGHSNCRTTDACLKSAANPFRSSDPLGIRFYADCADLPYVLRAYFAWKNGLPFGYVSQVGLMTGTPAPTHPLQPMVDLRYSPIGNRVLARRSFVARRDAPTGEITRIFGPDALRDLTNQISSAIFRIGPDNEHADIPSDFYPSRIDRNAIRPGVVIYDPAGHVAVVYAVEPDGRILYLDAHPDNSVTRGSFGRKFARSNPGQGAGFKNWRPIQLVGASQTADGEWIGGQVVPAIDSQIPEYSTVQFYGTEPDRGGVWGRGRFLWNGVAYNFYDYLRHALSTAELRYDPLTELAQMIGGLCGDLNDRVVSVALAITRQIDQKPHPERLPENIYGTLGDWEDYATPSRDARLKTSYREMFERTKEFVRLFDARDPSLDYSGTNLREDLIRVLRQESSACLINYRNTSGTEVRLDVLEASRRLYDLSFDPYDCIERRWGATDALELAGCRNDVEKEAWYRALRKLRNQSERTYDVRMDYTRIELESPSNPLGLETGADVDLLRFLRN